MQNVPAVAVPLDPLLAIYLHAAWNESYVPAAKV